MWRQSLELAQLVVPSNQATGVAGLEPATYGFGDRSGLALGAGFCIMRAQRARLGDGAYRVPNRCETPSGEQAVELSSGSADAEVCRGGGRSSAAPVDLQVPVPAVAEIWDLCDHGSSVGVDHIAGIADEHVAPV